MTKDEAYEKQRRERIALERENKKLKALVEEYNKGTYESADKIANLKQISSLTWENRHLKNERDRYKANWENQVRVTENFRVAAFDAECERDEVINERNYYRDKCNELRARLDVILGTTSEHDRELKAQIEALKDALLKEKSKADNDGTNSGIPTSQTSYGKKKVIPNSREKTGKKRGAQPGHEKHSLNTLNNDEITDHENHSLDTCPDCGSEDLVFIEKREKDIIDYEVRVIKKRHYFWVYQCRGCGHTVHSPIPCHLKESIQYGPNIQALGLALQDIGFVSINRTRKLMDGFIGNGIHLSEGYICKLQKRASKALKSFVGEVRLECIRSKILHWDDTVIFINTEQACMRFYGNERLALYRAHAKKDRAGIDEDGILGALGSETTVIHDHVTMNYNDDFHFRNAECIQHLNRELQKVIDISGHSWAVQMKELISKTIHQRNLLVAAGAESFSSQELYIFFQTIDSLLELAGEEHKEAVGRYYEDDERRLIARIGKYKDSHFLWAKDFSVAPTNNLAERSLRGQKIKLKVSGQYQSADTAEYFADIRTYIETCNRNGIDTFAALVRLTSGNPYSVTELLGQA